MWIQHKNVLVILGDGGNHLARINVDDRIYSDKRWTKLLLKIGDEYKAKGLLLDAWTLAQKNWLKHRGVPRKAWPKELDVLIDVELAEIRNEVVYVKGSKSQFQWLEQKVKAGKKGGLASGKSRSSKGLKRKKRVLRSAEAEPSGAKPLTHSLSLTPPLSQTQNSNSVNNIGANAPHPTSSGLPRLVEIWNEHCGKLPKVQRTNRSRDSKIAVRWKEQSPDEWVGTVKKIAASDFCNGKSNTGWRATFDWLIKPETWLKVNEGKYDNNRGRKQTFQSAKYDQLDEIEQKWRDRGASEQNC